MANARLRMARQAGKRRRTSDTQPTEPDLREVHRETSASNASETAQNELETPTPDVRDAVHEAFMDQKHAIEARLHALTLGKPLARVPEPGFDVNGVRLQRTHRDFLLQEMRVQEWMAADFAQERKWRLKSARTLAVSLANYHSKQATRAVRQQKLEDEAKRRLAARIGRDVKKFWSKIDKIISYKVKLQADELRKAAMDKHLQQLVAQTERYAAALATTFQDATATVQATDEGDGERPDLESAAADATRIDGSMAAERIQRTSQEPADATSEPTDSSDEPAVAARPTRRRRASSAAAADSATTSANDDDDGDSDFAMASDGDDAVDDESSIALADAQTSQADVAEELALLEQEQALSIDELRAQYAAALASESPNDAQDDEEPPDDDDDAPRRRRASESDDGDGDFEPTDDDDGDDESTIAAAEADDAAHARDVADEVALLHEESELSIDELRARYAAALASDASSSSDDDDARRQRPADSVASDSDEDFEAQADEPDDESTIAAAEQLECPTTEDVAEELRLLREESELSLDDLRAKYARLSDSDDRDVACDDVARAQAAAAGAEDLHVAATDRAARGGSTAPSAALQTGFERPYLLSSRLALREYQQAGVNWLVSLCEQRINGILADEMGLGKTIQTITLLAHLATARGLWGPHLIVVPTSCLVNWEMEFKRWCPAFKVLTYFGSAKRRKALRQGWSKPNAFQVCITSYQLAVQDAHCFKRKKWYYVILDEAHNIKNWKSLRWQTLLTFNSQRRLLLTGTPLQNNVLELWSLMHFLMPHVFASRREFTHWFQTPLAAMVEGETDVNSALVRQLHGIIRPFVLRRLKHDVAKQLPGKFEHVVTCKLSKRQRFLYEDFIARSSTRRALFGRTGAAANVMSMMNVLMQLRKVCNHPDLFEPRPIASPLDVPALTLAVPSRCAFLVDALVDQPVKCASVPYWRRNANLPNLELAGYSKYASQRWRALYYYDVSAPLPDETRVSDATTAQYASKRDVLARLVQLAHARTQYWQRKRAAVAHTSRLQVELADEPVFGHDLVRVCTLPVFISPAMDVHVHRAAPRARDWCAQTDALEAMVRSPESRVADLTPIVTRAVCYVPRARARPADVVYTGRGFAPKSGFSAKTEFRSATDFALSRKHELEVMEQTQFVPVARACLDVYYDAFKRTQLFFPDKRLVQFDCGKLQQLDTLLRELKRGNHRCLIFTQMSSMLNILEVFLNIHGHTYFRLDGSTKVEKRQALMDRFNRDDKIFCFILSTRSGGLGINLTGADSVIFYDSDWNPAMDAQAQDRAHRIGQTRDVHIYRLVSEHTVEENILKKAQQKRHLDFLVMSEGQFTTDFFSKASLRALVTGTDAVPDDDTIGDDDDDDDSRDPTQARGAFDTVKNEDNEPNELSIEALEDAMAQLEDEDDVAAMHGAKAEVMSEQREFDEETGGAAAGSSSSNAKTLAAAARKQQQHAAGGTAKGRLESRRTSLVAMRPSTPSSMSVNSSISGRDDDEEEDDDGDVDLEDHEGDVESIDGSTGAPDACADDVEAHDLDPRHAGDGDAPAAAADDGASASSGSDSDDSIDSIDDEDDDLDDLDDTRRASRKRKRADSSARGRARSAKTPRRRATSASAASRAQEKAREKQREVEEERKLQAWKDSVSSLQGFEDSLNPVDRYALHFREQIDPLYAYVPTAAAIESYFASQHAPIDAAKIDEDKMREEAALIADGELIAGIMDVENVENGNATSLAAHHRALYKQERAHVHSERRRRMLTGAAWELKKCALTNHPFYYNVDTREASWDPPAVWATNAELAQTRERGFAGLTPAVLLAVMKYLAPYPDRVQTQLVCTTWCDAARHASLSVRVNANDLVLRGATLSDVLARVVRGETVLFGSGVYQVADVVEIATPIKLLAAPDAHVELQMTTARAQLRWTARGGMLCGFHITRQRHTADDAPRQSAGGVAAATSNWQHLLHVVRGGHVRVLYCDFDGSHVGNACVAVSGSPQSRAILVHNRIYHGGSSGVLVAQGDVVMVLNSVYANAHTGVTVLMGNAMLRRNRIERNGRFGIRLLYHANNVIVEENVFDSHRCGNIDVENSGRRFVVRWNEMASKDEPEDLPHVHGALRLTTFGIVEREVPRPPSKRASTAAALLTASSRTSAGAAGSGAAVAVGTPVAAPGASGAAPSLPRALVVSTPASSAVSAVKTEVPVPTPGAPSAAALGPSVPASSAPVAVPGTMTAAAAAPVVAAATVAPPRLAAPAALKADAAASVTTAPADARASAVASAAPVATLVTATAAPLPAVVVPAAAPHQQPPERVKLKRKRRPKIEKLVVSGRVIVFRDSCEKRSDRVKKPRTLKADVAAGASDTPTASSSHDATSRLATELSATSDVHNHALATLAHDMKPERSAVAVEQPPAVAPGAVETTTLQQTKKKRGRKPKLEPLDVDAAVA